MMIARAFVPVADVVASMDELLASRFFRDHEDELEEYVEYFHKTWIGSFDVRGNRKAPRLPIPNWNCRDSVLLDEAKTYNYAEGFNRAFNSS